LGQAFRVCHYRNLDQQISKQAFAVVEKVYSKIMDELRRVLTQRLETVTGLLALVISDRDGVPIIKASSGRSEKIELCFR